MRDVISCRACYGAWPVDEEVFCVCFRHDHKILWTSELSRPMWTSGGQLRIWPGMNIGTRLFTWLKGRRVGADAQGNVYFEERRPRRGLRVRRWVAYAGVPEASKVPSEWASWLHYTTDTPLPMLTRPWVKPHIANRKYRHGGELIVLPATTTRVASARQQPAITKHGHRKLDGATQSGRSAHRPFRVGRCGRISRLCGGAFGAQRHFERLHAVCEIQQHRRADRRFGCACGAGGAKVGAVDSAAIDPKTYLAQVKSAWSEWRAIAQGQQHRGGKREPAREGVYLAIQPGADETMLPPGGTITMTAGIHQPAGPCWANSSSARRTW